MITNLAHADGFTETVVFKTIRDRKVLMDEATLAAARETLNAVKRNGYSAVIEATLAQYQVEPRELEEQELEDAVDRLEPALLRALEHTAKNIYEYQTKLLTRSRTWESPIAGGNVGLRVRGMHRVAVYVSGSGSAGAVLMNAIPARVAGVEEIVLVTPPAETISDALLAAAWVAGVDRVFVMGGACAVAALAYGADPIPKVDKLVGQGDAGFSAAKQLVSNQISVDGHDGYGDLCVIADEAANPAWAAADLLSQAERSEGASAVLLTPSEALANAVLEELEQQSGALRRKAIMRQSLKDYGAVVVCPDIYACVELANSLAPQHLELLTAAPLALLDSIQNAGCIYLGNSSPEALGEYAAGPSANLPTLGGARFGSPLTVEDFLKKTSVVKFSEEALEKVSGDIMLLSRADELTAHANAIKVRQK